MSINDKKQSLNQGSVSPVKASPLPPPKVEDKSIFGGKQYVSKIQFKRGIIKDSGIIPGTGGVRYTRQERIKLAEEMGGKIVGSFFEKGNFEDIKMFRKLNKERYDAKTGTKKLEIDRKIRFLEKAIRGKGK
ncbi:MAG: hypothetical protein Q7R53_00090 [bacterium]|nr:hypothetical protein [bacterium]